MKPRLLAAAAAIAVAALLAAAGAQGGASRAADPATVLANLNVANWSAVTIPGFDAPTLTTNGSSLALGIGTVSSPPAVFGFWQTKELLEPLAPGNYRMVVTLVPSAGVPAGKDHPDLRIRVFDEGGLNQRMVGSAESGDSLLKTTIPVMFESKGRPWGVAFDILGFDDRKTGNFRITSVTLEAL